MATLSRYDLLFAELGSIRDNPVNFTPPARPDCNQARLAAQYRDYAATDLPRIMEFIFSRTRPSDPTFNNSAIALHCPNDTAFDARVSFRTHDPDDGVVVTLSVGTLLALDDVFHRLLCLETFYNNPATETISFWPGGTCIWPALAVTKFFHELGLSELPSNAVLLPKARFQCYDLPLLSEQGDEFARTGLTSFLSGFFSGVPLDQRRVLYAQNMVGLALQWILMHEESHFIEGHLRFADQLGAAAVSDSQGSTPNTLGLSAESLSTVIEWHADRSATESVFDILMCTYASRAHQDVPDETSPEETMQYSLRFLMTSIGVVGLLFRLLETRNGVSAWYPTSRTRICTMLLAIAKRIKEYHARGDHRCGWMDYLLAAVGAVKDLDAASRVIGLEAESGLSSIPAHSIEDWEKKSKLGLFDDVNEHVYLVAKICVDMGFPRDAFNSDIAVSSRGSISNDVDEKWLRELGETVSIFDRKCYREFLKVRVHQ